jgi:hypothetical protein
MWTLLREHSEGERPAESVLAPHLPEYDVRDCQPRLLHADVDAVRAAIGQTDLTGIPVVRALLLLRALPGRLRARLGGRVTPVPPPFTLPTCRGQGGLHSRRGPRRSRSARSPTPGGSATRPRSRSTGSRSPPSPRPATRRSRSPSAQTRSGPHRTRVTTETRVATTDPPSRRRFAAYWVVVGPVSALIRRLTLRSLARHLPAVNGLTRTAATGRWVGLSIAEWSRGIQWPLDGHWMAVDS